MLSSTGSSEFGSETARNGHSGLLFPDVPIRALGLELGDAVPGLPAA